MFAIMYTEVLIFVCYVLEIHGAKIREMNLRKLLARFAMSTQKNKHSVLA